MYIFFLLCRYLPNYCNAYLPLRVCPTNSQVRHHVSCLFYVIYSNFKIPFLINCATFHSTHKNIGAHTKTRQHKNNQTTICIDDLIDTLLRDLLTEFVKVNFFPEGDNHRYYFENCARLHRYRHRVNKVHPRPSDLFRAFQEEK
jgi:hypothetical protein